MEAFSLSAEYEEIMKQRKEYWDSLFQKFASVTEEEDYSINDIVNNSSFEKRMNSLLEKEKANNLPFSSLMQQKRLISRISLKANLKTNAKLYKGILSSHNSLSRYSLRQNNSSQSQLRQTDNYAESISNSVHTNKTKCKKNKPEEIFTLENGKTYREHNLDMGINHMNVIYDFFLKNYNENIDFATFSWVKNIIEEDSSGAIEESLKDREFTINKIVALSKVLPKDEVLKYFRFYLQYVKLYQYVCNKNIDFATFLWVKNIIEDNCNRAIEESLKDKGFTRNKIITLVKLLPKDDVLKYFRFYLQYIKLHQYGIVEC
ncbi:uncharacterized protein LOC108741419 isoform X2 [Agrilus planipennis]|uniref:Uncharacterized protein LOC108741419 isoform X2 n=1 Tax=Agrilus planipennis TaxID=224129 RepID=A0A1W4XHA2_AGRPL|nr:uncharacterized protein LOC108741419 isoform X2 [Agrilus planipennis]